MTRGVLCRIRKIVDKMLNDPSRAFEASAFAESDIRQLDRLIDLLQTRSVTPELRVIFTEIDSILGSLYAIYLDELEFLAAGEPQNEAANQIGKEFNEVRPLISELGGQLTAGHLEAALESALTLKAVVKGLFLAFGDFRRQAATGPKYSDLPFTQELLRVAHHYLRGALPVSTVQARLDTFCNYHDHLEATFEQMEPNAAEEAVLDDRGEDLEEALALQLQGIEDLDQAIEQGSDDGVRKAIEDLSVAAEALFEIYQELEQASNAVATVPCPRCGAGNEPGNRQCQGCGIQLPRFDTPDQTSTMEFSESGSASQGIPEELLRLQAAVDQAISRNDSAQLEAALHSFSNKLTSLKNRMAAMKAPPNDIPAEHLEVLKRGKSLFQESLETLSHGYELLSSGAPPLDSNLLRRGLEEVEIGFAMMFEFGQTFQEAEQLSPSAR